MANEGLPLLFFLEFRMDALVLLRALFTLAGKFIDIRDGTLVVLRIEGSPRDLIRFKRRASAADVFVFCVHCGVKIKTRVRKKMDRAFRLLFFFDLLD